MKRWLKLNSQANSLNRAQRLSDKAYALAAEARQLVADRNRAFTDEESDWWVRGLPRLHDEISREIETAKVLPHAYFHGYPYQALAIAGVFGERPTEERFESYGLAQYISAGDEVIDLGCNCGFLLLYTSFRTGCRGLGIDHDKVSIRVGNHVADFLRLSDRVELRHQRIQEFQADRRYSRVFSMATHWTDDAGYRVDLRAHLEMLHRVCEPEGLVFFESHAADMGNSEFLQTMDECGDIFSVIDVKCVERETRYFYVLASH